MEHGTVGIALYYRGTREMFSSSPTPLLLCFIRTFGIIINTGYNYPRGPARVTTATLKRFSTLCVIVWLWRGCFSLDMMKDVVKFAIFPSFGFEIKINRPVRLFRLIYSIRPSDRYAV
jgi:hypothetical protein